MSELGNEEVDWDASVATYGETEAAMSSDRPNARFAGDSTLYVNFFLHPRKNNRKTAMEGRPIYDDCEYIEIRIPGDKDNAVIRPIRDMDKQRFPTQYRQFVEGRDQSQSGTPLEHWPQVTRAQVEELKHFQIHTVEQLVEMPDSNVQNFMGLQQLRNAAEAYLDEAAGASISTQLQEQLDEKDSQIAALMAAIEEQGRQIAELQGNE